MHSQCASWPVPARTRWPPFPCAQRNALLDFANTVYRMARLLSVKGKPAEAETELRTALLEAVRMGTRNPHTFRTAEVLDPIRSRSDFRLLMLDLPFSADPFAD